MRRRRRRRAWSFARGPQRLQQRMCWGARRNLDPGSSSAQGRVRPGDDHGALVRLRSLRLPNRSGNGAAGAAAWRWLHAPEAGGAAPVLRRLAGSSSARGRGLPPRDAAPAGPRAGAALASPGRHPGRRRRSGSVGGGRTSRGGRRLLGPTAPRSSGQTPPRVGADPGPPIRGGGEAGLSRAWCRRLWPRPQGRGVSPERPRGKRTRRGAAAATGRCQSPRSMRPAARGLRRGGPRGAPGPLEVREPGRSWSRPRRAGQGPAAAAPRPRGRHRPPLPRERLGRGRWRRRRWGRRRSFELRPEERVQRRRLWSRGAVRWPRHRRRARQRR